MPTPSFPTNPVPAHRKPVAVDTETFLIAPGRLAPQLVCGTFCGTDGHSLILDHEDSLDKIWILIQDDSKLLVLANAPFDFGVFAAQDRELLPWTFKAYADERIWDVQTWDRLWNIRNGWTSFDPVLNRKLDNGGGYNLADCVKRWLGEEVEGKDAEDAWRMRYAELFGTPLVQWPEEAKEYARNDATYTVRVQQQQIAKGGVLDDFWRQCKYHWALHLFSCRGLRTQEEVVREVELEISKHVAVAGRRLMELGLYKRSGTAANPRISQDQKATRERVVRACDLAGILPPRTDPSKKFPEGQISIDVDTLKSLAEYDEGLGLLAEVSNDKKLLGTYIPVLLQGVDYPINAGYNVLVDTGRTSSFKPNIQNVPRKGGMRECYVPRKGYIYVDCDYNIAELRSLSQVLLNMYGYSDMAEIISKGIDIHCMMAAAIMGISFDAYMERYKGGDKQCKEMRQLAKALDFGAPGGLGAATFVDYAKASYDVHITEEDARELLNKYKETFPEMRRYFADITAAMAGGNTLTVSQYGSNRLRGGANFCPAANSYFQGLTADGAKLACWNVALECYLGVKYDVFEKVFADWQQGTWHHFVTEVLPSEYRSPLYGSFPVWFIHDQIGIESPFEMARGAAKRLSEVMVESMTIFTPDVPCIAEADMKRRWYKEAEPTYNKEGDLVPWSPPTTASLLRKKLPEDKAEWPEPLLYLSCWREGEPPLSDEEAALADLLLPQKKKDGSIDPTFWHKANQLWRWEVLARQYNPDPWSIDNV